MFSWKTLRKIYLFNHSNFSYRSLEVVVYLFLLLKRWQSSILWSVLCRFNSSYHCCHSLSLIVIYCHSLYHSLSLVVPLVIRWHSLYHLLSLVVPLVVTRYSLPLLVLLVAIRCHSLYHSMSLVVTCCTTRLSFYKMIGCLRLQIKIKQAGCKMSTKNMNNCK